MAGLFIAAAPEDVFTVGYAVLKGGVPQPYIASIGRGGSPGLGGKQGQRQGEGKNQGCCSFHEISFFRWGLTGIVSALEQELTGLFKRQAAGLRKDHAQEL